MADRRAGLASAEVDIQSGKSADARRNLETLLQQANRDGYIPYELQARLLLARAELLSGQSAAARSFLTRLHSDAYAKGFFLIARQANAFLPAVHEKRQSNLTGNPSVSRGRGSIKASPSR